MPPSSRPIHAESAVSKEKVDSVVVPLIFFIGDIFMAIFLSLMALGVLATGALAAVCAVGVIVATGRAIAGFLTSFF